MIDKILQKYGLKYEELNAVERETLGNWMESLNKNALTPELIREYIVRMRESVSLELTQVGHGKEKDTMLKARLRDYILLEAFLISPAKAKEALERAISGIARA
jgi:hypothetical protein